MPRILFPASSAPGKDFVEGSGRLINAYSERLQEGAPAQYVIRRAPGLIEFGEESETGIRGMWYDGENYIYVAFADSLYRFDSQGTGTEVATLPASGVTFIDSYTNESDLTEYTFSDVPYGDGLIVVAVQYKNANDAPATVTVGGQSATQIVAEVDSVGIALFAVEEDSGTGDIVVTYATSASESIIGVWRINGYASASAYATESDTGLGAAEVNINVPAGGVIIAATTNQFARAAMWHGVDEDYDEGEEGPL